MSVNRKLTCAFAGDPVVRTPPPPVCYVSTKPASQCWTICKCTCKMVEALAAVKNMTYEELEKAQQEIVQSIQGNLKVCRTRAYSCTLYCFCIGIPFLPNRR